MRGFAIVAFLGLTATAAAAIAGNAGDRRAAQPVATATAGSFDFANSRDGAPVFEASDIGPGDAASGTVEIANEGGEPGELTLKQHDVVDTPGAGGGLLSGRMSMRIRDLSDPAQPRSVYDGALAPMPALQLGPLGPGQSRAYEFVATLPDRGTPTGEVAGDNAVQAAAVSVGYSWTAAESTPRPEQVAPTYPVADGTPTGTDHVLQLVILRVRTAIRHHRLVLWAYCGPGACSVQARLRFRTRGSRRTPARTLGLLVRRRLIAGSQSLVFKLPPSLQRALRAAATKGRGATVRVVLVPLDRDVERARVRKAVRPLHLYPRARHGRP
jgi:hypothetical protein